MLSVKRPTATTTLYTVSTRAASTSLSARLRQSFLIFVRIFTALLVAGVCLWEYRNSSVTQLGAPFSWFDDAISASPFDYLASSFAENLAQPWRLLTNATIAWMIFRKGYIEESLLVIRGLGVQTSTSSPSYLWTSSTRFIPTSSIQDIFIHEAFKGFEVRFYLSIVVEGEEDVVVVFPVSVADPKSMIHFGRANRYRRTFYHGVKYSRTFGGERELASTSQRYEVRPSVR